MLIYGLINSAVLALMALGFNLTFGISGVANFAYGAIYVVAGFVAWGSLRSSTRRCPSPSPPPSALPRFSASISTA